jgi:hypothetical protein
MSFVSASENRHLAEFSSQVCGLEGLHDVVGGAGVQGFRNVGPIAYGCDHEKGDLGAFARASKGSQQLNSRQSGHVPVGNDDVKSLVGLFSCSANHVPGLLAVFGFFDARVAQFLQHIAEDAAHRWHVVDYQDLEQGSIHSSILLPIPTNERPLAA